MSGALQIRVLGELSVLHDGTLQPLPRSRKARALLAYLAITGRSHRRDQLCDLLWDVTDDRRAALRWGLSKLRQTLGPAAESHLVATRERIGLDLPEDVLDIGRLRRAVRSGIDPDAVDALELPARAWNGELLEGMLLPDFDAFEAWLEAERSEVRVMHVKLRRALVERLAADPARALVHARAWMLAGGGDEARGWVERLGSALGGESPSEVIAPPEQLRPLDAAPALPPAPPPAEPSPPLVGRDRALARLRRIVRETREQRRGHVVLVIGEPGMGKTRLLEELRYRERDPAPAVLEATFHEVERERPLGPFLDATRGLVPETLAAGDRGTADREQLFESVASLLRRGSDTCGLALLVLDDAHLADPSSSELLHFIVRTSNRSSLLTVLACRPAELEENVELTRALSALRRHHPVEEITLGPLDPAAIRELVEAVSPGRPLESPVRDSAGVPLMALEMARCPPGADMLPRSLADLVASRLATLPDGTQALVRWAAVLEQGPLEILEAAAGTDVPDFVEALEIAARYRLLRVDPSFEGRGTFRMDHALVSRVVYESISPLRRATMHRVVAEAMSEGHLTTDLSAAIAHHAGRADRPDLAARALVRGGVRSAVIGSVREAREFAERALSLVSRLDPTVALALEIDARCLLLELHRPPSPGEWVSRLTALGLDALGQAQSSLASRAFQAAGRLRWETGAERDGYGIARQALRASSGAEAFERVRGRSMVALCLALMEKDLSDAHAIIHEAEALARSEGRGDEPAELALARALLQFHAGRVDEALRDATDARTLARLEHFAVREASALQLVTQIELYAGRMGDAVTHARELADLATRIREGSEAEIARAVLALAEPSLERTQAGLRAIVDRLRLLDDKRALAWVANRWAARERADGTPEAAAALAEDALHAALAVEAFSEAAIAACGVMLAAVARDDDDAFVAAEEKLTELEAQSTVSEEARRLIRTATGSLARDEASPGTESTVWSS